MYIDGTFSSPVFQSERSLRPIDGTEDTIWEETYLQLRANYVKQALSSVSTRHPQHYLVDETPIEPVGPENSALVRFTRVYAMVPRGRRELVPVAFTYPGKSGGIGEAWDRYKVRRPITLLVGATDLYSYFLSSSGDTAVTALTVPKFGGEIVDFFGSVYATEDPYGFEGTTSPSSEPATYTIGVEVRRWRGQIWEKVVRTVRAPNGLT